MESIEETLRKSKELSERYQKFVMEREKAKAEEEEVRRGVFRLKEDWTTLSHCCRKQ